MSLGIQFPTVEAILRNKVIDEFTKRSLELEVSQDAKSLNLKLSLSGATGGSVAGDPGAGNRCQGWEERNEIF